MSKKSDEKISLINARLDRIERILGVPETQVKEQKEKSLSKPSHEQEQGQTYEDEIIFKQGNLLGIVAVICFVFAAGFIIKLSIDSGWLTPHRQVGMAAILGISLILSRFAFVKLDSEYASFLPAAGSIILYITALAAHSYYHLITTDGCFMLIGLVSALCIWLFLEVKHDIFAIITAVGSYVSPLLLTMNNSNTVYTLLYYYLICSLTFGIISIWLSSRLLTILSSYLAILLTGLAGSPVVIILLQNDINAFVAIILALHFFIFSLGTYLQSRISGKSLSNDEAMSFSPVLLIFYVMEYHFIYLVNPEIAPWISLGFATFLMALYLSAKRVITINSGSETVLFAFISIICVHSLYLNILPDHFKPWFFVIVSMWIGLYRINTANMKANQSLFIPYIAMFIVLLIEYVTIIGTLIFSYVSDNMLVVSILSVVSIWTMVIRQNSNKSDYSALAAANILAVSILWYLTRDVSSLAVSLSWLFYAVSIILFSYDRKDKEMAQSALLVLLLATGKVLLIDVAGSATVIRILCLLSTGAVLYGSGLVLKKADTWKRPE